MAINILIVDDSKVMRSIIKKTLNLCEFEIAEVYEAGDGQEGLHLLEKQPVDMLFIDINMPIMDGMEMLKNVRSRPETESIAVFIISTESNDRRIKAITKYGAKFIHKPFTPETLRRKVIGV